MKTKLKIFMILPFVASLTVSKAQIRNAKTVTIKIYGNCEICKSTIEKAAFHKKHSAAVWNPDTQMAILTFNSAETSENEILKRVAYAGYDNEKYLAPEEAYADLPGCCQYHRPSAKIQSNTPVHNDTANFKEITSENQFQHLFKTYFELKNALVKSDGSLSAEKAADLLTIFENTDLIKMNKTEQNVWKKISADLKTAAGKISDSNKLITQRQSFSELSALLSTLAKVSSPATTLYLQQCSMYNNGKGAVWLSLEREIKNPYYGSQMLSCGKTIETIKKQ